MLLPGPRSGPTHNGKPTTNKREGIVTVVIDEENFQMIIDGQHECVQLAGEGKQSKLLDSLFNYPYDYRILEKGISLKKEENAAAKKKGK